MHYREIAMYITADSKVKTAEQLIYRKYLSNLFQRIPTLNA